MLLLGVNFVAISKPHKHGADLFIFDGLLRTAKAAIPNFLILGANFRLDSPLGSRRRVFHRALTMREYIFVLFGMGPEGNILRMDTGNILLCIRNISVSCRMDINDL